MKKKPTELLILIKKIQDLEQENANLKAELEVSDKLLEDRTRLLEAIPPCEAHGQCMPSAMEWISKVKTLAKVISG